MDCAGQGGESQQREISYEYGAQPLWRVVRMKLIGHMSSLGTARLETLAGSLSLTNGAPRPGCHDPTAHCSPLSPHIIQQCCPFLRCVPPSFPLPVFLLPSHSISPSSSSSSSFPLSLSLTTVCRTTMPRVGLTRLFG